jgi:hypothetical protein
MTPVRPCRDHTPSGFRSSETANIDGSGHMILDPMAFRAKKAKEVEEASEKLVNET